MLLLLFYSFPAMTATKINAAEVQYLSFERVSDSVDSNWVEWIVSFKHNEKHYVGILGACPHHPDCMHGDIIEEVEEA